jgi:hypothetical protein
MVIRILLKTKLPVIPNMNNLFIGMTRQVGGVAALT